ncbi:hypothetical protein HYT57_01400 [Candidatus Woesearchaeota archaeon]|nr:hypothetical protein [Candidatus Woesearchaeota archaeon]
MDKRMRKLLQDPKFRRHLEKNMQHKSGWGLGTLVFLLAGVWLVNHFKLLPDIPLVVLVAIVIIVYFLFRRK